MKNVPKAPEATVADLRPNAGAVFDVQVLTSNSAPLKLVVRKEPIFSLRHRA